MGATGVVSEEYRGKLDELAARLGLSKESAKLMFHAALRQRMGPMMQQVRVNFSFFVRLVSRIDDLKNRVVLLQRNQSLSHLHRVFVAIASFPGG